MTSTAVNTPFPLGAYLGNPDDSNPSDEAAFEAEYNGFTQVMGTTPQFFDTFVDQTQPIADWLSNTVWAASSAAESPDAKDLTPVIALPMASLSGTLTADQYFQAFASGQFDSMINAMVKTWAAEGFTTQYWRPGWEMNLSGSVNYAGANAQTEADFVAAFQHIYTVLHAAGVEYGVNIQVIWNPGVTNYSNAAATTSLYPGNNFVDIIGADAYADATPYSDTTSGAPKYHDWATGGEDGTVAQFIANPVNMEHYWSYPAATEWNLDSSGGHALSLDQLLAFAEAEGKPFAIPETGAGNSDGGGDVEDDAAFPHWLSAQLTAAQAAGETIDFVNLWDSNGGGNYEFSNAADDKPLEAAAWAQSFGAQSGLVTVDATMLAPGSLITVGSGTDTVALLLCEDAGSANATFTVSVDGTQIGGTQTVTAAHSLGQTATLDVLGDFGAGSHIVSINFQNQSPGGASGAQTLYLDAASYDGLAASDGALALSSRGTESIEVGTPLATPLVIGSGRDVVTLSMSEDYYLGDADFTVSVDGIQVGGTYSVTASHAEGQSETVEIEGEWGAGTQVVAVDFLNDMYAGTPSTDRNLYVTGAAYDGVVANGASLALMSAGTQGLTLGQPMPGPTIIGSGRDIITLDLSEDYYLGNADFTVAVDGEQIGGTQSVVASHADGQAQVFEVEGEFGAGTHVVSVDFLNDLSAGTPITDRNLYVVGAGFDGTVAAGATLSLFTVGTQGLVVGMPMPPPTIMGTGRDLLILDVSEDYYLRNAQFTVSVDGTQIGGTETAVASHALGQAQTFEVAGNFGDGPHTVAVDFLNDAYAGTPITDRNLFVTGATFDGLAATDAQLSLLSAGTQTMTVGRAPEVFNPGTTGGMITTATGDTVHAGSGAVTINAAGAALTAVGGAGPLTVIGGSGADTVSGGSGSVLITANTDSLTFAAGHGNATIQAGAGSEVYNLNNGQAGGAISLLDYNPALDEILLHGYAAGAATQTLLGGSTLITLADGTRITLVGTSLNASQSVFD